MGVMLLQVKERLEPPETGKDKGRSSPRAFRESMALMTLRIQTSILQNWSTASRDLEELVGALGGSVTFPLNSSVKQIGSIVWIFNTTLLTLQPQEPNKSAVMIVTQSHKKERVSFPNRGYSLTLSKLQKNDSGIYRVEIHSLFQQRPFTQEYVLRVYEHLSKPKVTMGLQKKKNGTCMTNLTCSMEQGGEDVTYSWKTANESHDGSILPISWTLGEKNMTFICMARNPISRNFSNPISSWNLCEEFTEEKKGMETHQEIPDVCSHSGVNTVYDTVSYPNKTTPEEDPTHTLYSVAQTHKTVEKPHSLPMSLDTPGLFTYENII
ncbi:SLAM family member 7 isoform X3 [Trichechus manatus latirostris]|uniref:SLAM family member 7 isoform X3 n=1 Tax=Trichechus manatus latirostris TaxID=127582 RepID=A0A2Y9QNI7_TRIMA|nr:SLAM family member 7 isoform X3 [Trichechus manatus latirostris]